MTLPLQLHVLFGREDQPHAAGSAHGDLSLKVASVLLRSIFAPALLHLQNLVCGGEGQALLQVRFEVGFHKADLVSLAAKVVHVDAMGRWLLSLVHRLHEVGHAGIVGCSPVEVLN